MREQQFNLSFPSLEGKTCRFMAPVSPHLIFTQPTFPTSYIHISNPLFSTSYNVIQVIFSCLSYSLHHIYSPVYNSIHRTNFSHSNILNMANPSFASQQIIFYDSPTTPHHHNDSECLGLYALQGRH